jgi:hypothetical protein
MQRMIVGAHEAGWISDEEFNATKPVRPLNPHPSIEPLQADLANDPLKLIEYLRAQFTAQ